MSLAGVQKTIEEQIKEAIEKLLQTQLLKWAETDGILKSR